MPVRMKPTNASSSRLVSSFHPKQVRWAIGKQRKGNSHILEIACTKKHKRRRKNPLYAFMLLFPFMPVSTLSANLRLHLGGTRAMKTGYVCLLLGLGFYFLFGRLRATGFLENHTTRQNLFYIHIIQMLSVPHLPPKRIPLSVPPYNRLLPAILPYRYNH